MCYVLVFGPFLAVETVVLAFCLFVVWQREFVYPKYSGLGLPPKLSAITMLNISCGSAQDNLR